MLLCLGASGCITSPTWDYGKTAEAKESSLGPCPNGMIDDGEDGDSQIIKVDERDGYWFTSVDEVGSEIQPKGDFKMAEGGPEGSKHAARATGKTAATGQSIYVVLGFGLTSSKVPYDARPAKGVRFWAKGPARIRLKVPDVNTAPEGDRCSDCYNDFGVDLDLSDRWERYTIPFDKMGQSPGWGDRAPRINEDQLFAIQFLFGSPDKEFEYWVDNIEFVGCEADSK
ncbi:MAG TPA: hypothetical protein VF989_09340 [Polyangiaceae bacterium]